MKAWRHPAVAAAIVRMADQVRAQPASESGTRPDSAAFALAMGALNRALAADSVKDATEAVDALNEAARAVAEWRKRIVDDVRRFVPKHELPKEMR